MGWIALTAVLALTVLVLGLSLLSLRRALREVAEELEEKLAAAKDGTANRSWVEKSLEDKGFEVIDDVYRP